MLTSNGTKDGETMGQVKSRDGMIIAFDELGNVPLLVLGMAHCAIVELVQYPPWAKLSNQYSRFLFTTVEGQVEAVTRSRTR